MDIKPCFLERYNFFHLSLKTKHSRSHRKDEGEHSFCYMNDSRVISKQDAGDSQPSMRSKSARGCQSEKAPSDWLSGHVVFLPSPRFPLPRKILHFTYSPRGVQMMLRDLQLSW